MSDDLWGQIANAGGLTEYPNKPGEGEHVFAISKCEERPTLKYGRLCAFEFVVVSSTTHAKGVKLGDAFFVDKPGLEGDYNKKRVLAIGAAVVEGLGGDPSNIALVQNTLAEMFGEKQAWKGVQITCSTASKIAKKSGKPFLNNKYGSLKQTAATLQASRAEIEGSAPVAAAPAAKPALLPPPAGTGSLLGS